MLLPPDDEAPAQPVDGTGSTLGAARVPEPEQPRPLMREMPEPEPFPVDALGPVLGAAANAIQDRTQAPLAICGQAVLSAASLAAQAHADVQLPVGQVRPLSLYAVTVAASGERKSTVDRMALGPVHKREEELRAQHGADMAAWQNDHDAWKKAREKILKKRDLDRAAMAKALQEIGPEPNRPITPMLVCTEPTFEGLCRMFPGGQPSLGIFSAEGAVFIGGHGMAEEAKLRTAGGLSMLWDAEPIGRVRAGDGATVIAGRRVALHLMVQPDVSTELLADRQLADQGLLSRILVTAPSTTAGTRFHREPDPAGETSVQRYETRLLEIMEQPLLLAPGSRNELRPRVLEMSSEAKRGWIAFADSVEGQLGLGGLLEPIKGFANKLPEHAARIAGVLTMVDDPESDAIGLAHLKAGIALAEHYKAEWLRLWGASRVSGDLHDAKRLLEWLRTRWQYDAVSLPDIYMKGPSGCRDKKTAAKLVQILEDHGYLDRVVRGAMVAGVWRRDVWSIISDAEI